MTGKLYEENSEEMMVQDHLAADRTSLANERTYLAYVRTALALVAGGFGLIKLIADSTLSLVVGWILIPVGLIVLVFGTIRFIKFRAGIKELRLKNQSKKKKEED